MMSRKAIGPATPTRRRRKVPRQADSSKLEFPSDADPGLNCVQMAVG